MAKAVDRLSFLLLWRFLRHVKGNLNSLLLVLPSCGETGATQTSMYEVHVGLLEERFSLG